MDLWLAAPSLSNIWSYEPNHPIIEVTSKWKGFSVMRQPLTNVHHIYGRACSNAEPAPYLYYSWNSAAVARIRDNSDSRCNYLDVAALSHPPKHIRVVGLIMTPRLVLHCIVQAITYSLVGLTKKVKANFKTPLSNYHVKKKSKAGPLRENVALHGGHLTEWAPM